MGNFIVIVLFILSTALLAFLTRVIYLVYQIFNNECKLFSETSSLRTIMCIGSGGHTTELLRLTKNLDFTKYQPRLYILADNDTSSEVKIHVAETDRQTYEVKKFPRSRNVLQSYTSSVFTTVKAFFHAIPIVYKFKPDLIFCNGPGTCVPICVVAFLFRCLFIIDCRIVFIESICRVKSMSLTGKILQYFADIIVVQWYQLKSVCYRAQYFGRLS